MRRGDLVMIALQDDFGKPRPALVVQSDFFNVDHPTITLLPLTSEIRDTTLFRVTVEATGENGLRALSQVMVDKPMTLQKDKVGAAMGRLAPEILLRVNRALALWMGLA